MATKIRLDSQVQGTLPEANAPLSLTKTPSVSTTEVASQGGLLINIDNAVGDVSRSSTGFIEGAQYGWYFVTSVGSNSAKFDSSVKGTGRLMMKLTASDAVSRGRILYNGIDPNSTSVPVETLKNGAIPVVGNTKYAFKFRMQTETATDMRLRFATYNSTGVRLNTFDSTNVTGTTALLDYVTEFTTNVNAVYMTFAPSQINVGTAGSAWFDVNGMKLDLVTEPVTNSLTSKSPSLVGFTAVGSTDNVDQSSTISTGTTIVGSSAGVNYVNYQSFTASKEIHTGAIFYKKANVGSPTGDLKVELRTDNGSGKPSSTVLASCVITLSAYNALATNAEFTASPLTARLVPGTKYHYVLSDTATETLTNNFTLGNAYTTGTYAGGNGGYSIDGGSTWVEELTSDRYFKSLYYKPSTNFTARQNNDVVSISADSDGFLEGAKIDLENGTFSWDSGIGTSAYDTKPYNSAYFRTVGTWGLTTANRLLSGSTNAELVYKIPSWVDASVNFLSTDSGGSFVTISASTDGVTYTAIAPAAYDVSAKIPFGSAFLKITANGPNAKAEKLEIKGTFDTSSFKTLYNYPTNQDLYATYVKTLSTATTTATYRATKYGFPAIEFADGVYTFLKVDTTATGSTVALSADGTTYTTVADGAGIGLTSTTYPIVYVRSNITANRLYVSSNDYNADSAKDGSLKCNVQYKSLTQGLIYDVHEVQEKLNDLYTKPAFEVKLYQKPLLSQVKEGLFEFFNNSLYFTNLAVRRSVQQAQGIIVSPTTVANTLTETTILTCSQGANYLRVGKIIIPRILGRYSTNSSADFFTIRLKYGGVTILTVQSATAPAVTDRSLFIESYNTVTSIGASGTLQSFIQAAIDNVPNNADASSVATINTTVAQDLTITVQWNNASVKNSITIAQGYVEAIDA